MLRGAATPPQTATMLTTAESIVGLQKCVTGKALVWVSGAIAVGTVCEKASESTPFLWRWLCRQQARILATDPLMSKDRQQHHLLKRKERLVVSGGALFALLIVVSALLHRSQRRHRHQRQACCQQARKVMTVIDKEEEEQEDCQPEAEVEPGDSLEDMYDYTFPVAIAPVPYMQQEVRQASDLSEVVIENRSSSSGLQLEADSLNSAAGRLEWPAVPRASNNNSVVAPLPAMTCAYPACASAAVGHQENPFGASDSDMSLLPVPQEITCTDLAPASTLQCDKQLPPAAASSGTSSRQRLLLPQARRSVMAQSEPVLNNQSAMRRVCSDFPSTGSPKTSPTGKAKAKGWVRQMTVDLERRCAANNSAEEPPARMALSARQNWPRTDGLT